MPRPDLLTGRAWVTHRGQRIPLTLCEEGADWLWLEPGGRIAADGATRTSAIGALLAKWGAPHHQLELEVSSDLFDMGLCALEEALLPDEPEPPPQPPAQKSLF